MINVTNKKIRDLSNFWNNIHFHPTDAIEDAWGQEILEEVAQDHIAKTIRLYAMFEDIFSLDENGQIVENYTDNDTRLDYLLAHNFTPLVCYAYMPKFLAKDSNLTQTNSNQKLRYKGKVIITSEPTDYSVWEELCRRYTKHIVDKYGIEQVSTWRLQCWNEPDIHCFFMSDLPTTIENFPVREKGYFKLYKSFVKGILSVTENVKIGGPSQGVDWNFDFLNLFLTHVKAENIRIDFVSIHVYGAMPADVANGIVKFSYNNNIVKYQKHISEISKYFNNIEIIIDEWGAAGHGFVNAKQVPLLIFRENSIFSTYYAKMVTRFVKINANISKMLICLSGQHELTNEFTGFRGFFTLNHIKKPIYNAFALMAKLGNELIESSCDNKYVDVLATKENNDIKVAVSYCSENFDEDLSDLNDEVEVNGLSGKYELKTYIIDKKHTNPYEQSLNEKLSIDELKEVATLKPHVNEIISCDGIIKLPISITNNGLIFIQLTKIND